MALKNKKGDRNDKAVLYHCPYKRAVTCDMRGACLGCEAFAPGKIAEESNNSPNTDDLKCDQCENFDVSRGVFTIDCYSCKRYNRDLFTPRKE